MNNRAFVHSVHSKWGAAREDLLNARAITGKGSADNRRSGAL